MERLENKARGKKAHSKHYVTGSKGSKKYYTVVFSVTPPNKHGLSQASLNCAPFIWTENFHWSVDKIVMFNVEIQLQLLPLAHAHQQHEIFNMSLG